MKPTKTLTGAKARKAVIDGVNAIYEPTSKTLGPQGKNALLYRTYNRGPRITNDGYTVAGVQEPKNEFVRLAAQAFREACQRTNEKVGDGTTTTVVIAGELMNDVYKLLTEGQTNFTAKNSGTVGVMTLRKKILDTAELVKKEIKKTAKKVKSLKELERIATISVEDEELGKVIAKMAWDVGVDGFIDTVEGYKGEVETEVIKGMRFPAKVPAKAFVNNAARYEMVAQDCPVFVTNYALDNAAEVSKVFQGLNKTTSKIIVIAPSFSENTLVNMVNASKQGYFFFPVAVPSLRTDQFEDVSVYCGATFIDKNKGKRLKNARPEDLGFLEKLIVKDSEAKEDAIATGGAGTKVDGHPMQKDDPGFKDEGEEKPLSPIEERINTLKDQLKETRQDQFKKLLERRIGSMSSAIGIIRVGDSTDASALYRKLKIEDAVYACKAALRGGYVKGGGLALKEIAEKLPDDDILKPALIAPYEQIQASVDGGMEISEDVIDPAEAVYYEVEHATSVVANLATVEVITPEMEDPINGEGEHKIADAIHQYIITKKLEKGLIKENEVEAELEKQQGLNVDELVALDNG